MAWDETTGISEIDNKYLSQVPPWLLQIMTGRPQAKSAPGGLPPVSLGGGAPQPAPQVTQPTTNGAAPVAGPATPPVRLTGAPTPDLPAPIENLEQNPQNLFNTPAVSLAAQPGQQQSSRFDGVVPLTPADHGWLKSAKHQERLEKQQEAERGTGTQDAVDRSANRLPAVRLSDSANTGTQVSAPQSAGGAGNGLAMLAAARMNGGGDATGSAAVQPRTPEDEYRDLLTKEPTRDQFPAQKMGAWKKVLGAALSTAAGVSNPALAGETARKFFGAPERKAEEQFDQAHQQWEGKLGNFMKAAQLHHLGTEDRNLQSEIDTRNAPGTDHAKLAELYADAVKKATQEGRDLLQDSDVKRYGDAIQNIQREPAGRGGGDSENTPFKLWRQQHPNADVSEYFKLQPEARNATRPPKEEPRLTPGQKMVANRKYKAELSTIEDEFRERQSGTYVDRRSGEMLPAMTQEELSRRKQDAEDAYKDELEAGGEKVSRYDYRTQGNGAAAERDSANAASAGRKGSAQHQVGDEVTYNGQRYRISGIKNGKAQLAPLGSNQ
jgi:hypothetical protein